MNEGNVSAIKYYELGVLKEAIRILHANAQINDWVLNYLYKVIDEAKVSCPLKIKHVYRGSDGQISGFRFESLAISLARARFVPNVGDVMNAFAKWLVEQFGEPHES